MALSVMRPITGDKKQDWDRSVQVYGFCEIARDHNKSPETERSFRDWAVKRGMVCVEGERMVAFDPKSFNPKDSLDRGKYGFLARYFRPRESIFFQRDLESAFGIRSMFVRNAVQTYWVAQGIVHENGGQVQVNRDLLRLMGFTYIELMQALDGVVRKSYLEDIPNGHKLIDPALCYEYGHYLVNFDIMRERFFDSAFLLQQAGQPLPLTELGRVMGVDDMEDLRKILREAKKRFDLNIEVSENHVMFGPPSEASISALIGKERNTKTKLAETEGHLKDRLKTIKDLLDRYSVREAKILNEMESLREEGRLVYVKGKVVSAIQQQIDGKEGKVVR